MIRIVHLSDFHLNKDHLYDAENFILKALVKDLRNYNNDEPIDLILFSGDLVDKGGISFDKGIEDAFLIFEERVLEPIFKELSISNKLFFFCPGNHDIDRYADDKYVEQGLCQVLTCTEEVNKFIASNNEAGIKRILPFKDFEKAYHKSYPETHKITNFHSSYIASIGPHKVGITCFNSCWRCYDSESDKERIVLGERQVIEAREIIKDCDLKLAIMHHPLDWLAEFDKKAVRNFLHKDYDIIFCGHVHEGTSWVNTSYYGGLLVSVAPSNWSFNIRNTDRIYANGYSIIDYDILRQKITVHHRRYSHQKESFDPNTDLANEFGIAMFDIPRSSELSAIQEEIQVATQIEDVYCQSINEHLLSYNTDTKAPKSIEELFVHPRLVHKIEPDPEKEEQEENYEILQLCDTDENIVIFGTKESGKTILLDKILIDLTKNIFKYKKTPVYYDFLEVKGKRFETIISRFLNVGIRKIDEFLNKHKLVLLIDNLSFNDSDQFELNRLEKFLDKYPSVQVIATSLQSIEDIIPVDFFKYAFYASFTTIHIKSFKTKEIRALIKHWFSKSELLLMGMQ
jgi:predicted MPP superfamily phosphohydrolase